MLAFAGCGSEGSGNPPGLGTTPVDGGTGRDGGGTGTDGGTVAVAVSRSSITAGDAGATVTATVQDADNLPLANETVTFTASPATRLALGSTSAVTDADGKAEVALTGLSAGPGTVTAHHGTNSATASVTVAGPNISASVTPSSATITASNTSGAGAVVTFTVTDDGGTPLVGKQVSFTTTLGTLDAATRTTDADGRAQVKLTSETAGPAGVTATVLGVTSSAVVVTVDPADMKVPVTVTTSANKIATNGSATITIQAADEFGNPVNEPLDVSAVLLSTMTPTGDVSPGQVQLVDGSGSAVFTPDEQGVARIRVSRDSVQVGAVDVSVELVLAGEPAQISFTVTPSEIAVQGGGGTQSSAIDIQVLDVLGDPIQDGLAPNNLQVEIVQGPNGGESLDGLARLRQVRTLSTSSGQARVELQSGVRPGTVLVEVRVTKDSTGADLATPLVASVPQITIRSGPPASLFLTRSNAIQSPGLRGNGSITHDYLAFVSDLWGNSVPDDTIVFFSQFLNIKRECRNRDVFDPVNETDVPPDGFVSETCLGADAGTITPAAAPTTDPRATFVSGSVRFDGPNAVLPGDTLVIITEDNPNGYGGYRVSEVVDAFTLRLDGDVPVGASELEWAIGNNANLGGGVFTTEGEAATAGGVARWSNTYAGELVNSPVYVFAEAEGGGQGHARFFRLSWAADTNIEQTGGAEDGDKVPLVLVPDELDPLTLVPLALPFSFYFEDASSPTPYAVPNLNVQVTATGGQLSGDPDFLTFEDNDQFLKIESTERSISEGFSGGTVGFWWAPPAGALAGDEFTITVAGGGVSKRIKLTIQ